MNDASSCRKNDGHRIEILTATPRAPLLRSYHRSSHLVTTPSMHGKDLLFCFSDMFSPPRGRACKHSQSDCCHTSRHLALPNSAPTSPRRARACQSALVRTLYARPAGELVTSRTQNIISHASPPADERSAPVLTLLAYRHIELHSAPNWHETRRRLRGWGQPSQIVIVRVVPVAPL